MRISDWSSDVCSSDLDVYIGFNLAATDPVRRAAERSVLGFGWQNILDLVPMTDMERTTFETGRRHGLVDGFTVPRHLPGDVRSAAHTSDLQYLMCHSYAVFCLKIPPLTQT